VTVNPYFYQFTDMILLLLGIVTNVEYNLFLCDSAKTETVLEKCWHKSRGSAGVSVNVKAVAVLE
jgi:hypothetical protein